jgi:hypothetical protein
MTDIVELHKQIDEATDEIERPRCALKRIEEWSRAYPLKVFPKPDYEKARQVLEAADMTLDSISADCMRHVVVEVGIIARRALEGTQ